MQENDARQRLLVATGKVNNHVVWVVDIGADESPRYEVGLRNLPRDVRPCCLRLTHRLWPLVRRVVAALESVSVAASQLKREHGREV